MEVFDRERLPVVLAAARAEIRRLDLDGMTVAFYRLPAVVDARPFLAGTWPRLSLPELGICGLGAAADPHERGATTTLRPAHRGQPD